MTFMNSGAIISKLKLERHPEGGYYRRTYVSSRILPGTTPERSLASAIVYFLPQGEVSRLHKIDADEIWHHYDGDQLVIVEISTVGEVKRTTLGKDFVKGETLQHVVNAGVWFGSYIPDGSRGALVGCTVHPEFLFDTFELARREHIIPLISPSDVPIVDKLL
jgi:predicted cupin superfamily sugar epimerase